jgi:hypothetical protein
VFKDESAERLIGCGAIAGRDIRVATTAKKPTFKGCLRLFLRTTGVNRKGEE